MNKLHTLLRDIETKIALQNMQQQSVSASSIGWHIEHTLLTINIIIKALTLSNVSDYRWSFRPLRYLIFGIGKIPRGKAKAPKIVQPKGDFDAQHLKNHLQEGKHNIQKLDVMSLDSYFKHPYFGHLKLKPSIKFLCIHTQHHISIVESIVANQIKQNWWTQTHKNSIFAGLILCSVSALDCPR